MGLERERFPGHGVWRHVRILLRDKRHRISPWRHVLATTPYQNNIIIPATPRLS